MSASGEETGWRRCCSTHDVTVILYFAAWLSGCTIIPINVEEAQEKKRFILEHSEAAAVCCWHTDVEELKVLQRDLPSLRQVIAVSKEGLLNTSDPGSKKAPSPSFASGVVITRWLEFDNEALIVYTSGTTGPSKGVVLTVANLLTDRRRDRRLAWVRGQRPSDVRASHSSCEWNSGDIDHAVLFQGR